jgi:hypothetical protein
MLERRIRGKTANQLIEQSEGPGSLRKPTVKISFSKQSAYTVKYKGIMETFPLPISSNEPDIQLVLLSVRKLIAYIDENKSQIEICINEGKALSYIITTSLSYIFEHGNDKSLTLLREKLGIKAPNMIANIGLQGYGSSYTLIIAKKSTETNPFGFSPILSAMYTISCLTILTSLANITSIQSICLGKSKINIDSMKYYLHVMPKEFEKYANPSFLWCSQFLKDTSHDVQRSAKSVMKVLSKRLTLKELKELGENLSKMLLDCQEGDKNKKGRLIIALALLSIQNKEAVDGRIMSLVAMGLIEILIKGGIHHITAISLLGDAYHIWQYYIPEPLELITQLFHLSIPTILKEKSSDLVSTDSYKALISMSSVDPKVFLQYIGKNIHNTSTPIEHIHASIISLGNF